jgi:DNA invertase Pin-like site-specific DNA recombinase
MVRRKPRAEGTAKVAVGYCRVSTAGQASEGVSLEAQRGRIAAWAEANGYQLLDVHVDAGLSGGKAANRPALQAALDAACSQRGALVVYSLSRLARSVKDTLSIGERLDAAGADLVSLSESIDTTSAAGRMVFRMLAVLSEFERDLVVERTTMALQHKRSRGERVGEVPFGYRLAADGTHLEGDEAEQQTLAVLRDLRASGLSVRAIADDLNRRGIPARDGRWHHNSVWRVLRREAEAAA